MARKAKKARTFSLSSDALFTPDGERKYMLSHEVNAILSEVKKAPLPEHRSFIYLLSATGCRVSEALELTYSRFDLDGGMVVFRTLKQEDETDFRAVHLPEVVLETLDNVHRIRQIQSQPARGRQKQLWTWNRSHAWRIVKNYIEQAGITGAQATVKGFRHSFAVLTLNLEVNPFAVQTFMGHKKLDTTMNYAKGTVPEQRPMMQKFWDKFDW